MKSRSLCRAREEKTSELPVGMRQHSLLAGTSQLTHGTRCLLLPTSVDASFLNSVDEFECNQGDVVGTWSIYYRSPKEIITGFDRSFIDFRVSLFVTETSGAWSITATTVARFNNIWGRLYFIPVRYGHMIVLGETMRRMKHALTQTDDRPIS